MENVPICSSFIFVRLRTNVDVMLTTTTAVKEKYFSLELMVQLFLILNPGSIAKYTGWILSHTIMCLPYLTYLFWVNITNISFRKNRLLSGGKLLLAFIILCAHLFVMLPNHLIIYGQTSNHSLLVTPKHDPNTRRYTASGIKTRVGLA